jgi:CPA1 family monovalent cation:H+ antiporter
MSIETTLVILFAIATSVAITVRWFRIPYTAGLVLAGLLLGLWHVVAPPHLTRDLLFAVFLPGLIFEAAFNIDVLAVRSSWMTIGALAVPGVVMAIALTGIGTVAAMHGLDAGLHFSVRDGLIFGAVVAATDPIAVVALFKQLRVPTRLATLVEGESLFNDGTSIVLLALLLSYTAGQESSWGHMVLRFGAVVGGGAVVGLAAGLLASYLISHIDDAMIEITITVIAAYGSFALAEQVDGSGVIATVVTGMLCGDHARRSHMSPTTQVAVNVFWEYIAFALNSVVFLLIGFEVHLPTLGVAWLEIGVVYLVVLIARGIVVALTTTALRRTRERMSPSWNAILIWGGLRGALSMVLVLALPSTLPNRDLLITLTFGIVLLSILMQGLSMQWLLTRVGVAGSYKTDVAAQIENDRAALS